MFFLVAGADVYQKHGAQCASNFVKIGQRGQLHTLLPTRDKVQCLTPVKTVNSLISNNHRLSQDLLHTS